VPCVEQIISLNSLKLSYDYVKCHNVTREVTERDAASQHSIKQSLSASDEGAITIQVT
jgi:hypothetical protein